MQLMEPMHKTDERGNDIAFPELGENSLMQQMEPILQSCFSPEEEEELCKLEMQTQDIEDEYNSNPYLEHMKANQIMQFKVTMECIICKLEQIKEENPWEKLGYTTWYRKLSALYGNTEMGTSNEMTITHMAETNAYLTKRINTLEMKLMQDTQTTNHDPNMCVTLMTSVDARICSLGNPIKHHQSMGVDWRMRPATSVLQE